MPEHQQVQQSTESKSNAQKQVTIASPTQASNPYFIIQRAKIDPKSLTHADIMQLQRTIGNRAVGMLLSSIRSSSVAQQATVQRQEIPEEEEPLQDKMAETVRRQEIPEPEEEPLLQGKFENKNQQETCPSCSTLPIQRETENRTGMPDDLKTGVESLSGIDMGDVRVHYNSSKPADVGALAYTQGTDIHVAPGQERHLPHEAWHVVQQAQGRVRPTMQLKDMAVNDDVRLESEADVMGWKAIQLQSETSQIPDQSVYTENVTQLRTIPDLPALKRGIIQELDTGETDARSDQRLLSSKSSNVNKLTHLYTPMDMNSEDTQKRMLKRTVGNVWREEWFDRVDQRVKTGAEETMGDVLFWAEDIKQVMDAEEVNPSSVELLGEELHDRGLGPAKATFVIEENHNPLVVFNRTYVIKPEDRSVEKAILGSGDSVATRLNAGLSKGRQVNTLDIKTDANHGTIMEYVSTSLKTLVESVLRKMRFWDSTETVTAETIALAMLTGLYDLHDHNVMSKGSAPALIDADVAARPLELNKGPSPQAGFSDEATKKVESQIGGDKSGASQILQCAIDNPDAVISMITDLIGNHRSRIVPVHTDLLTELLADFVFCLQNDEQKEAGLTIERVVNVVKIGDGTSPGLTKELGPDQGNFWDFKTVLKAIRDDFDKGVIPHFQYESATGQVFLHGHVIWQGITLAQSMAGLKQRLLNARL